MKVLHVCLANFYIDNHSYQENMLTKYHKSLGYEVEIIASLVSFDADGKPCLLEKSMSYFNEHGIQVTRLDYSNSILSNRLRTYKGFYLELEKAEPDIIFIHGCQFVDINLIVKYVKNNPDIKVYVDNHSDFNNSGRNFLSKNILHKILWKRCAKIIEPFTSKFYGVLPARVDFLIDVYKVPKNKVDLLVMGVDDEKVKEIRNNGNPNKIREELDLDNSDFIIVTGGKIDFNKSQTLNLMEAISKIDGLNIKLIVFGSVIPELKEKFSSLLTDRIKYIGWINSADVYKYFNIADLVVFPGLHSVLWEQAVGFGKPCIFKYIKGFTHVDLGGNCEFFYDDSTDEILEVLKNVIFDKCKYKQLLLNAEKKGMDEFSYKTIAYKSLNLREV